MTRVPSTIPIPSSKALKGLRSMVLALVFATGVATGGVALNCLNKAKDEQDRINENLPNEACRQVLFIPCTSVNIDVKDLAGSAIVVVLGALLSVVVSVVYALVPMLHTFAPSSSKLKFLEPLSWAFCTAVLLGGLIPLTVFFATRKAGITVMLGDLEISTVIIDELLVILGEETTYKHIGYLKPLVIIPWFTMFFSAVAAGVSWVYHRQPAMKQDGLLGNGVYRHREMSEPKTMRVGA
ncbi:uncharacterized protein EV420DRAFT_712388 [Desarmillaria tabescens]|uniref:Transmembrane protein n=1 Tax=Armillaria tabescens TaxID=1929756 RepID=A0AA39K0W2_ARMTA|nr:uncharacterized protein EV420DRAFT_712388 [Desarmillaria tabescens]KAK0451331.1 hypothetical protein EV420DRAFT_712388 [Desarmillaria tabescens]